MNCDRVFDILTRGPFPTGDPSDGDVESHLLLCGECRRLAEALQPAVELLHEAVSGEEGRDLPGYWGALFDPSDDGPNVGSRTTVLVRRRTRKKRVLFRVPRLRTWRMGAAVALGVILAVALWGAGITDPAQRSPVVEDGMSTRDSLGNFARFQPTPKGYGQLASLNLPHDCFNPDILPQANWRGGPASVSSATSAAQVEGQRCCTGCHASGGELQLPTDSLALVTQSCEACHTN